MELPQLPQGFNPKTLKMEAFTPPRNTTTYSSSRDGIWSRFNDGVADIGNWFADHTDVVTEWISYIIFGGSILAAIAAIISIWVESGFIWALLGGVLIVGVGYYAVGLLWLIVTFAIYIIMYCFRLIFWNAYVFLLILAIVAACAFGPMIAETRISPRTTSSYSQVTPTTTSYRCTANSLNVRAYPSSSAKVIGSIKKNAVVQVYDITSGFAEIRYAGKKGYVSTKYLQRTY